MQTDLVHVATGEMKTAVLPLPETGKSQEIGSAITYARRYTLVSAAGLTSEEDDDGEAAGDARPKAAPKANGKHDAAAAKAMQIKSVMEKCGSERAIDQVLAENAAHITEMPDGYEKRLLEYSAEFKRTLFSDQGTV